MIRPFFALSAGLMASLLGWRKAYAIRREAQCLQRWHDILLRLALLLEEAVLPLPAALRAAADADLEPDRLLRQIASALEANPLLSLPEAFEHFCPPGPERETLLHMAEGISRGSARSRQLAAEQSARIIALTAQNAAEKASKDAKLYQTLGWTGGVTLALMLL